jgi:hypothetical protein
MSTILVVDDESARPELYARALVSDPIESWHHKTLTRGAGDAGKPGR